MTRLERPTNHSKDAGQAGGGVAPGSALSPVPPRCAVPGMATRIYLRDAQNLKSLPSKLLEYTVSAKPCGEVQGDLVAGRAPILHLPHSGGRPGKQERLYLHGVPGWRCPTL